MLLIISSFASEKVVVQVKGKKCSRSTYQRRHTYHTTGTTWYGMVGIATLPHYHTTPEEGRPPATFSLLSPVGTSDPSSLLTFSPAIHLSSAKTRRRNMCYLGLFFLKSLSNFQANIIFIFCHTYVAYRKQDQFKCPVPWTHEELIL